MKPIWVVFFSVFFLTSCSNDRSYEFHGNKLWEKTYGGSGHDVINSVVSTTDGGALLGGSTSSSGAGRYDMYLIRIDESGNKLWEKTYGGSQEDVINSVASTPDGGALLGGTTRSNGAIGTNMFLVRVDEDGNKLWEKSYGGSTLDLINALALTRDGGALLGGLTLSSGTLDMYLVRVDEGGKKLWEKTYGGSETESIQTLALTSDGGALLGGKTSSSGTGRFEMYLVRIDENGNKLWEKTYGGSEYDGINTLALTPDGGAFLGGSKGSNVLGHFEMYLLRIDERGNKLWETAYGGSEEDVINSLVTLPDGGALLGGNTSSNGTIGTNMSLVRVDKDGNSLWEKTYGESDHDILNSVVLTPDGGALLGGTTRPKVGSTGADMYIIRVEKT